MDLYQGPFKQNLRSGLFYDKSIDCSLEHRKHNSPPWNCTFIAFCITNNKGHFGRWRLIELHNAQNKFKICQDRACLWGQWPIRSWYYYVQNVESSEHLGRRVLSSRPSHNAGVSIPRPNPIKKYFSIKFYSTLE